MYVKALCLAFFLLMSQPCLAMGQAAHVIPPNVGLDRAMKQLVKAIGTGDTALFLSFVSKQYGVKQTNTIDSKHLSSAGTLKYTSLAADFRLKKWYYHIFFQPGDVTSENYDLTFFDEIKAVRQGRWKNVGHDTFFPALSHPLVGRNDLYIKWKKIGGRWMLEEIGQPES